MDNFRTTLGQLTDNNDIDEVIESKIKACQRENGKLMTSTSQRLRKKYGYDHVNRVRDRLAKRRQRGNQYQKQKGDKLMNLLEKLLETKTKQITL